MLPAFIPVIPALSVDAITRQQAPSQPIIKLFGDGEMFDPGDYITRLQEFHAT